MTLHRGAIDVARVGALVLVVLGHLALAVIDRGPDGALRGVNLLALHPDLAWLAMLAPMPVFFAAAGWANASATPLVAAPRLRTLVGLGAVVVTLWSTVSMVELAVRGEGGVFADGARIATQPLWFLAAYVPFAAFGARLARMARRPVLAVGAALAATAVLDAVRFGFGAPRAIGWLGFWLAWGVPWLLGAWWRGRWEAGRLGEARTGIALAGAALAAAGLLVWFARYHPSLIDVVDGERSNTTPPTLYTAVASVVQVGLLMVAAAALDRVAARHRNLLDRAGAVAVGVYVWHLTALAICAGVIAAGFWAPTRFSAGWWISRPLWFVVVLGLTGALVALTAWGQAHLPHRRPAPAVPDARVALGLVAATAGAGVVGLFGPRTAPAAVAATVLFVIGWYCLPIARRTP